MGQLIKVEQRHIDEAIKRRNSSNGCLPRDCPLALGISDAIGEQVGVGLGTFHYVINNNRPMERRQFLQPVWGDHPPRR